MSLKSGSVYLILSIFFLYLNLTPIVRDLHGLVSFFTNPLAFFYTQTYSKSLETLNLLNNVQQVQVQNKQLKEEITKLKGDLAFYKKLYDEKTFIDKQKDYYGFDKIIYADIIGRDFNGDFNTFLINKGLKHSVNEKDNLAYNGYAVGYVKKADPFRSLALSIESPGLKVPAVTLSNETTGVFNCSKTVCFVQNILQDKPLKEGDIFVTSGIAGVFKKSLILGTVQSIEQTPEELFKKAVLKREVNLKTLNKVVLLKYE